MNTATITQSEIDERPDLKDRAALLRERGAPIPEGEINFSDNYLVIISIECRKVPGEFPVTSYTYEWEEKVGD